ncbi:O-antigen ligase-like membrane protein [Sinobacterium caligoides]|uniref:O-antigen ligase-like membrane protein n=1 Tax=Sinobacterium caligoides TaxID=933926 RepID=A0A3N2DP01_9GAMM|nr:O-antigen ligase family protein [Sinobacterium caligoides]ROS01510.1 O-antigen ligase-like membrane protein [Sinobacterium caligoides]
MSEFKYVIFFFTLFVAVPAGYLLASQSKVVERLVIFFYVFFGCHMADINFISLEAYRGTSKGFEIGMIDMVMYILVLLVIKRKQQYPIVWLPPGSILYFIYFFFSCLSTVNAEEPIYSAFEMFKMVRMYIYFWAWYNYCQSEEQLDTLLHSFGAIIFYTWFVVVQQKYLHGVFQSSGPFPHQNTLVLYMATLGSVAHALILNRRSARPLLWFVLFAMCGFCVVATLSRAGLALFLLNAAIIFTISIFIRNRGNKQLSKRKTVFAILMPIIGILALFKAADSIIERFETAPEQSKQTRILLAEAAIKMANDKTMGVGLNNFGLVINPPYSYGSHIPMINEDDLYETHGLVETAYLLVAAETGWHNLAVFVTMLFYFYYLNIKNFFRYKGQEYRFLTIAFIGCLSQIYLQSTLEWVLKQTNNFFQIMLVFATIGVMQKLWLRQESMRKSLQHTKNLLPPIAPPKVSAKISVHKELSPTSIKINNQEIKKNDISRYKELIFSYCKSLSLTQVLNTPSTKRYSRNTMLFFKKITKPSRNQQQANSHQKRLIKDRYPLRKIASTLLFLAAAIIFMITCYQLLKSSNIEFINLLYNTLPFQQ